MMVVLVLVAVVSLGREGGGGGQGPVVGARLTDKYNGSGDRSSQHELMNVRERKAPRGLLVARTKYRSGSYHGSGSRQSSWWNGESVEARGWRKSAV